MRLGEHIQSMCDERTMGIVKNIYCKEASGDYYISYSFTADGKTYTGEEILAFDTVFEGERDGHRFTRRRSVLMTGPGKAVAVSYRREDPSVSYLPENVSTQDKMRAVKRQDDAHKKRMEAYSNTFSSQPKQQGYKPRGKKRNYDGDLSAFFDSIWLLG